jgi:hypothetical protein
MAWPYQPNDIWRDLVNGLNPLLGPHRPDKAQIRVLLTEVLARIDVLSAAAGFDPSQFTSLRNDLNELSAALDSLDTATAYTRQHLVSGPEGAGLDLRDPILGLILARFGRRGLELAGPAAATAFRLRGAGLSLRGYSTRILPNGGLAFVDRLGIIGPRVSRHGIVHDLSGRPAGDYSAHEVRERNARALALAVHQRYAVRGSAPSLAWAYNLLLVYGQSLGAGQEAWPALTVQGIADVLMWGRCERPAGPYDPAFVPVGDALLRPLVATCQRQDGTMLTAAQAAALPVNDPAYGETILPGALAFARQLHLKRRGQLADPDRKWVGVNCSVSGRNISQLMRGASPNLYQRLTDAISGVKAATPNGSTFGVGAVMYLQGEFDYFSDAGGTPSLEGYKAKMRSLFDNIGSDSMALTGQADPPMVLTYQTGGSYTVDATGLSIAMAQLQLSEERDSWHLVAPSYPVSDKGGHLNANGSRWLGCQFGKVLYRTQILGERWRPTSPLQATVRGRTVLVDFHVPCPPLQFQDAVVGNALKTYPARGFTVTDAAGKIPIRRVDLASDTGVAIYLTREPQGEARVWYGRLDDAEGGGNLCDSDPTRAPFNFEYTAGSGQYPSENIAALVGKPYPLWNWCVAFNIAANRI